MSSFNSGQFATYLILVVSVCVVTVILDRYASHFGYNHFVRGEPRETEEDNFGGRWVKASPQLYIYSAYYDHRQMNGEFGQVQIMAFESVSFDGRLHCYLYYRDSTLCLTEPAKHLLFRKYNESQYHEHNYNPTMYSCVLPNAKIPTAVAISSNKYCASDRQDNAVHATVNISFEKWEPRKQFGVCVHSPLFNVNDRDFVAGFIELNRILGAEWFTFYVHSVSARVRELLHGYQDDGLVEVRSWGKNMPTARYYGQDLSMQDCLYRNLYKVKYLIYIDLDEVIFPNQHQNWNQMMRKLDEGGVSAFSFPHVLLIQDKKNPYIAQLHQEYGRCNHGDYTKLMAIPRYLSYTMRSKRISKNRSKLVVKPLRIRALKVHRVLYFADTRNRTLLVDGEFASLLHYRSEGLDKFRKRSKRFYKLRHLIPKLFSNLKSRLC